MRRSPVFEKEDALPSPELQVPFADWNYFARPRQNHLNVRGRVVRALGGVGEVRGIFWHKTIEELLEINPGCPVCVFEKNHTSTCVLDEHGGGSRRDSTL